MNSLHPLHHQSDELLFQIPLISSQQESQISQDMILMDLPCCDDPIRTDKFQHWRRKSCETSYIKEEGGENNIINNNKKMKTMHKEVERQRRQEMATLYGSLRSLVPHEYLKGKRSISDHMNEATKYIRQQQKKIKAMVEKRDALKQLSSFHALGSKMKSICSPKCVTVQPCYIGVEVIICCGSRNQGLPLSEVLEVLNEEALSVLNCASNKVNGITCYTIQSEVSDSKDVNLSGLQQKLIDLNHVYENSDELELVT